MNNYENIKKKYQENNLENPLSDNYLNISDKGLVSQDRINPLLLELQNLVGEFGDLYSVSTNSKTLSSLDFSKYGKNKYLNHQNLPLINKIIDYSNSKDIHYIHIIKTGGIYLKTVFFHKSNYNKAIKFMSILWSCHPLILTNEDYHIGLGLLLDYLPKNIIHFVKTRFNLEITEEYLQNVDKMITNYNDITNLENILKKKYNIIYCDHIENII